MKQGLIAPSMMCVDFSEMTSVIEAFEKNGIGYLHIDIMDGHFVPNLTFGAPIVTAIVPNYTLGTDFCRRLRTMTRIPLDLHLMITRPDNKLDWFQIQPGEYVSVHWESTPHIPRVLARIRELGGKPMLALNPATPLSVLDYVLEDIDGVLLMTVNPGFAGQRLLPSMLEKITQARAYLDERGFSNVDLEVDGNVSFENAKRMRMAGANIFVAGSSSIFSPAAPLSENIATLQAAIQ